MANYYRQLLNAHALKNITKMPNIPDYHLMVGSAEELAGLPTLIHSNYIPEAAKAMTADINKLSDEEVAAALENNNLEVNDFMENVAAIGSGLGGV